MELINIRFSSEIRSEKSFYCSNRYVRYVTAFSRKEVALAKENSLNYLMNPKSQRAANGDVCWLINQGVNAESISVTFVNFSTYRVNMYREIFLPWCTLLLHSPPPGMPFRRDSCSIDLPDC